MNNLFLTPDGIFNSRFDNIINKLMMDPKKRVLLLTSNNVYQFGDHVINGRLNPQDELINDINKFVRVQSSFIMNLWDARISDKQGQDVESIVLSLLASFVNNILEPRILIVDEFYKYSNSIQERIFYIQKNGQKYGIDIMVCTDHKNVNDTLLMQAEELLVTKSIGPMSPNVSSLLGIDRLMRISKMNKNEYEKIDLKQY